MSKGGRPRVGKPTNVRIGGPLRKQLDSYAERNNISLAQAIRMLLSDALNPRPVQYGGLEYVSLNDALRQHIRAIPFDTKET